MTFTNRTVVSIAAAAMLLGGSAGAFLNSSISEPKVEPSAARQQPVATQTNATPAPAPAPAEPLGDYEEADRAAALEEAEAPSARNQKTQVASSRAASKRYSSSAVSRTSSSRATRPRTVTSQQPQEQRAYYDYTPEKKTWWQKHRDLTTVGIGAGVGAAVGGIAGGKKGAAIGALAGGGGSALWTYKLRKRN